ncbi:MAG: flavoprotein [Promethearchaeota archaeon]
MQNDDLKIIKILRNIFPKELNISYNEFESWRSLLEHKTDGLYINSRSDGKPELLSNNNKIAWAITGAGHLLRESVEVIHYLIGKNINVDVFFSKAGREVAQIFGELTFLFKLKKKFPSRINLIFSESQEWSFPICGKFSINYYKLLIVSPTTANTVAKLSYKIADTLVTNIVSQALKGKTPVFIVPTDFRAGPITTITPIMIDHSKCHECNYKGYLKEKNICPQDALDFSEENIPSVNLKKCIGCQACLLNCKNNAITFRKKITIYLHESDIERTSALKNIKGIFLIGNPADVIKILQN